MRTTLAWAALVTCVVALAGCTVLTEDEVAEFLGETSAPGLTGRVTSPDGTITVDLPEGWYDHSAPYLERTPNSSFSAAWGTKPAYGVTQGAFASVSTVPVIGTSATIAELGAMFTDSWRSDFVGDIEEQQGEFATNSGGRGVWTSMTGLFTDHEATLIAVVILDHDRGARIAIEAAPGNEPLAEALLEALHTVELAPVDPITEGSGEFVDGAFVRSESISATIPTDWMPYPCEDDVRDFALRQEAAYTGIWFVTGGDGTDRGVVSVSVAKRELGSRTPADYLADAGPVGSVINEATGRVTVTSGDEVTFDNGAQGARVCVLVSATEEPGEYEVCTYVLDLDTYRVTASLESLNVATDELAPLEGMLASISVSSSS